MTVNIPCGLAVYPSNVYAAGFFYLSTYMQVGIDLIGPLTETPRGNKYIVTLVDYFCKWPEAELLPDKSAKEVALFLYKMMCR